MKKIVCAFLLIFCLAAPCAATVNDWGQDEQKTVTMNDWGQPEGSAAVASAAVASAFVSVNATQELFGFDPFVESQKQPKPPAPALPPQTAPIPFPSPTGPPLTVTPTIEYRIVQRVVKECGPNGCTQRIVEEKVPVVRSTQVASDWTGKTLPPQTMEPPLISTASYAYVETTTTASSGGGLFNRSGGGLFSRIRQFFNRGKSSRASGGGGGGCCGR